MVAWYMLSKESYMKRVMSEVLPTEWRVMLVWIWCTIGELESRKWFRFAQRSKNNIAGASFAVKTKRRVARQMQRWLMTYHSVHPKTQAYRHFSQYELSTLYSFLPLFGEGNGDCSLEFLQGVRVGPDSWRWSHIISDTIWCGMLRSRRCVTAAERARRCRWRLLNAQIVLERYGFRERRLLQCDRQYGVDNSDFHGTGAGNGLQQRR